MRRPAALLVAGLVGFVGLVGCSDDDDDTTATANEQTQTTNTSTTSTTEATSTSTSTTLAATTTTARATTTTTRASTASTTEETATEVTVTGDTSTLNTLTEATDTQGTSVQDRLDTLKQALDQRDLGMMLDALELSGVADELKPDQEITVLAPTNDAFDKLSRSDIGDLLTNPSKIKDLIRRHILDGAYTYEELGALTQVKTISGETLAVTKDATGVQVAGALVSNDETDVESGKIVVLKIDQVLLDEGA